jgi:hypothetical protein
MRGNARKNVRLIDENFKCVGALDQSIPSNRPDARN